MAADPDARPRAVDLGIAIQLTNIVRDVRKDVARPALPAGLAAPPGASPRTLLIDQGGTFAAVRRLLALVERHYCSAALGYPALPGRSSLTIPVAAGLYRRSAPRSCASARTT